MSARDVLRFLAGEEMPDFQCAALPTVDRALGAYRAEILRDVADDLESRLVKDPWGEAEEHVNECYREDIRRLRREADEAAKGGGS